ncbi:hypothetical protein D3C87_868800 [compost metagenome]
MNREDQIISQREMRPDKFYSLINSLWKYDPYRCLDLGEKHMLVEFFQIGILSYDVMILYAIKKNHRFLLLWIVQYNNYLKFNQGCSLLLKHIPRDMLIKEYIPYDPDLLDEFLYHLDRKDFITIINSKHVKTNPYKFNHIIKVCEKEELNIEFLMKDCIKERRRRSLLNLFKL